jgi:hypothetical protein
MKRTNSRINKYDGDSMLDLIDLAYSDAIVDDELTRGRIRAIYVRVKYGKESIGSIAEYYGVPETFIRDLSKGKIFADITQANQ